MCAFAADVDVLTVEIEHVDADAMQTVVDTVGCDVEPTPSTLRTIQVRPSPESFPPSFSTPQFNGQILKCPFLDLAMIRHVLSRSTSAPEEGVPCCAASC